MTADLLALVPMARRPCATTRLCPSCHSPLSLGPVIFWCGSCHRDVQGSLVDHEYGRTA